MDGLSRARKARFYISVGAVYALTLIFALTSLDIRSEQPALAYAKPVVPVSYTQAIIITEGKPVRLVVPRLEIDLQIEDGLYDTANKTWTLSGYNAHFALASTVANDYEGNTFIYGHNNMSVFGKLAWLQPGDTMQIFTDNGRVFNYSYESTNDMQPDDLSVFTYKGPPTVTIQTCAGSWNEIRRMYHFKFTGVNG